MKALLLLFLQVSQAPYPCDWKLTKTVEPMTDIQVCSVSSQAAKLSFNRRGTDRARPVTASKYRNPQLSIRVDDNRAVYFGEITRALDELLPQIESGTRIRTSYRDFPDHQAGGALICDLPELLRSCDD